MVYTDDWDESIPADHTKFSQQPGFVRSLMIDVAERLENMFNGFIAGETQTNEGVKNLPFVVQGSDPGATANKIKAYAKDVSAKAELHLEDEDANVIQVTTGGKLNAAALSDTVSSALFDKLYPVGIVVTFGVSTNPNTLFGFGTWTAIEGKVIVGIDAAQSEFDTLNETGGSKTHTLTTAEMPSHNHSGSSLSAASQGSSAGNNYPETKALNTNKGLPGAVANTGGGAAHNNLQPYIVKYVWERVS